MKHFTTAIHPAFSVGQTDPRLFGSFVEHMGSVVYNGIFQPGHPCANEKATEKRRQRRFLRSLRFSGFLYSLCGGFHDRQFVLVHCV